MQGIFLKKHWHIYKGMLGPYILDVLNNKRYFTDINDTYFTLIPKVAHATALKDYHPISLSNNVYKPISNFLANRLKTTLKTVINNSQGAFIGGRLIKDNAVAAFEAFHTLNGDGNSGAPQTAIKVDMVKAFDRVE